MRSPLRSAALVIAGLALATPAPAHAQELDAVWRFDAAQLEAPESIAADWLGNLYVSLAITGEVARIDPDGNRETLAFIPLGAYPAEQCSPGDFALLHGLAVDLFGHVYVGAAACSPDVRGIWRISPSGNKTRIASLPLDVHPNGLALYRGHVYVTDHGAGRIYRTPKYGNGQPAELWLASELLAFVPNDFMAPGANGIQFYLRTAYVANSAQQTILAIDLDNDDAPVSIEVAHDFFPGCDDMAIDLFGRIYCATNPFQTVVRVDPDGSQHILFAAANGLDGPTALTFGRLFDSFSLYIANAAFPFFPGTGHGPSVLVTEVDVPGYPLR